MWWLVYHTAISHFKVCLPLPLSDTLLAGEVCGPFPGKEGTALTSLPAPDLALVIGNVDVVSDLLLRPANASMHAYQCQSQSHG